MQSGLTRSPGGTGAREAGSRGDSFSTAVGGAWKHIDKITEDTVEGCWQYILGARPTRALRPS